MHVPLTIGDFLERAALVHGADRVAVIDEPGVAGSLGAITYAEMHDRARGMALALDAMGVGHGERVAIVSPNSARFLISYFGVSGFGRVLVPVNFRLNADEVQYIVEHSGASVLLVDPEIEPALAGVSAKVRMLLDGEEDAELFAPAPPGAQPARWEGDEAATCSINYTSGTTARPKGVQLTHRNCWLNAAVFGWHTTVTDRDTFLHTLPMFHCNGWGMPYAVTAMGAQACRGAQDRRRGDPDAGSRRKASPCCAAPRRWWPPSSVRRGRAARSGTRRSRDGGPCGWWWPARRRRRRPSRRSRPISGGSSSRSTG